MKPSMNIVKNNNSMSNLAIRMAIRALHILQADVCGIWLADDNGGLVPYFYYGIKAEFANILFSNENFNVLQCVLKQNIPLSIYDLGRDHNANDLKVYIEEEGLGSMLACPITASGERLGVMAVCTKHRRRRFTQTEKMLIATLADEIGVGILNEDLTVRIKRDYLNTIKTIAYVLEANDEYTYGHSNKVMAHAVGMCQSLGLKEEEIYRVKNAALLHDIGKVGIKQSILIKETPLSDAERQEIKRHPVIGADIVKQAIFLDDLVPLINHHHEQYGGGGYPDPELKGGGIPLGARIIAIADAYDAMVSTRPYRKKPLTMLMAIEEIRKKSGSQFDPELSKVFIDHLKRNYG